VKQARDDRPGQCERRLTSPAGTSYLFTIVAESSAFTELERELISSLTFAKGSSTSAPVPPSLIVIW
jgi:hypothetical protein